MNYFSTIFLGVFTSGILFGAWPIVCLSGVAVLILKRSYVVLMIGVALDIMFVAQGGYTQYLFFYTALFLTTTVFVEFVRSRIFWKM